MAEKTRRRGNFKVGDKVLILSKGNTSAYGVGSDSYNIGDVREIISIIDGAQFKYQLGKYVDGMLILTGYYKYHSIAYPPTQE